MEMNYTLFYFTVGIAIIEWAAVYKKWRKVEYIAKPGVMVALLAFVAHNGGFNAPFGAPGTSLWFFIFGLIFSLAGDVFLILPKEQFIAGLASFLLAHVCYILGFGLLPTLQPLEMAAGGVLVVLVALPARQIYQRLSSSLTEAGKGKLKLPVALYIVALGLMMLAALGTLLSEEWRASAALLATAGAALFVASDSMLAWYKFVSPFKNGRLIYMIAYHSSQFLLTLAAMRHFLLS